MYLAKGEQGDCKQVYCLEASKNTPPPHPSMLHCSSAWRRYEHDLVEHQTRKYQNFQSISPSPLEVLKFTILWFRFRIDTLRCFSVVFFFLFPSQISSTITAFLFYSLTWSQQWGSADKKTLLFVTFRSLKYVLRTVALFQLRRHVVLMTDILIKTHSNVDCQFFFFFFFNGTFVCGASWNCSLMYMCTEVGN